MSFPESVSESTLHLTDTVPAAFPSSPSAGDHLETYLAGAGLHNIASQRFRIPFGRAAKDQEWSDEEIERGDQTALKAFVGLKRP